jgi:hypothetical protein
MKQNKNLEKKDIAERRQEGRGEEEEEGSIIVASS